jgi:hypothetical protein
MRNIYASAAQVLVWLGRDGQDAQDVRQLLQAVSQLEPLPGNSSAPREDPVYKFISETIPISTLRDEQDLPRSEVVQLNVKPVEAEPVDVERVDTKRVGAERVDAERSNEGERESEESDAEERDADQSETDEMGTEWSDPQEGELSCNKCVLKTFASQRPALEFWRSWTSFFQRQWFIRIWVFQEYCLGSGCQVYCGVHHVDWAGLERLSNAISLTDWRKRVGHLCSLRNKAADPFASVQPFGSMRTLVSNNRSSALIHRYGDDGQAALLLYLLSKTRPLVCSIPHDKIYGLVGLLNMMLGVVHLVFVKPDYFGKVEDLYHEVTVFMLEKGIFLSALLLVEDPSHRELKLCLRGYRISVLQTTPFLSATT